MTPLHIAVMWGYTKAATLLVNAGANITISNIFGTTPLDIVESTKRKKIIALFQKEMKKQRT